MRTFQRLSFALIFNLLFISVFAGEVTTGRAQQVAMNFYYERLNWDYPTPYHDIRIINTVEVKQDGELLYFVFNFDPPGYVIVPATDAVMPVLGYSLEGGYSENGQPDNFRGWMDYYKRQLLCAIHNNVSGSVTVACEWERLSTADIQSFTSVRRGREVEPMLLSQWDQGYPYNAFCPVDPNGVNGHCVTGCVATAMGQLMYYFRWPPTGTGSYSYQHPDYGTLSADFGNTTYHWNEMLNKPTTANPAIAELLYQIGVSVDMDYGPQSSGMWNHKAAYSLRTYFKYSPETQYVYRDSTSMDWDSLVTAHLNRAMPCYYAGWADYTYTSGHAFIVDGYQGDYFHMNWGWSGSFDGYFTLDNLTPGGNNFNYAQELVINCFPDTTAYDYPAWCAGDDTLTAPRGTFEDGSSAVYPYQNNASCSWLISPQTEQDSITNITLTFNRFNTLPGDTVYIYDGNTETAGLLGAFAGDQLPGAMTSSGNQMLIKFMTGDEGTGAGWFASYSTTSPVWCNGVTTYTEPSGDIGDGSGTFNYNNNTICQFRILPPGAATVTLTFNSFDTEEGADWVKVIDMGTQTPIGEFSGSTLPEPVTATSGKMLILFTTNGSVTAAGWDASYTSSMVGIKENESDEGLTIYPNPARQSVRIEWERSIPQDIKVEILTMAGKTVAGIPPEKKDNGRIEVNISTFRKGIYIVKVITKNKAMVRKLVIQ